MVPCQLFQERSELPWQHAAHQIERQLSEGIRGASEKKRFQTPATPGFGQVTAQTECYVQHLEEQGTHYLISMRTYQPDILQTSLPVFLNTYSY